MPRRAYAVCLVGLRAVGRARITALLLVAAVRRQRLLLFPSLAAGQGHGNDSSVVAPLPEPMPHESSVHGALLLVVVFGLLKVRRCRAVLCCAVRPGQSVSVSLMAGALTAWGHWRRMGVGQEGSVRGRERTRAWCCCLACLAQGIPTHVVREGM